MTAPAARSSRLAAVPGAASHAAAQSRSEADARTIDGDRLTLPTLRKVLPAFYAPGVQSCPQSRNRDPHTVGIGEMVSSLERCPPVLHALRQAGVPPREAAIVFASLLRTGQQVALRGGKASALPAGVLRENALLLEQNGPELSKLSNPGADS